MARLAIEGAEAGSLAPNWVSNAVVTATPPAGFSGSYYFVINGNPEYVGYDIGSGIADVYMAWKNKDNSYANDGLFQFKDSAGTVILTAIMVDDGVNRKIDIRLGNHSATIIVSSDVFPDLQTDLFEVRYVPLNGGGVVGASVVGASVVGGNVVGAAVVISLLSTLKVGTTSAFRQFAIL